jgi:hypothetical protein
VTQQRCNGTNKQGEQCRGKALPGSAYCIAHDPAKIVAITEARRKGGAARSNRAKARREMANAALSPAELQGLIAVTIRAVLAGTKSPGIGQAIAALSRAAVAVREATETDERIAALEEAAGLGERRRA